MKFNHLNVPGQWKNYWTRYPEGHTILEALISWVSQVDSMVDNQNKLNVNVEQFRNEIDEFVGRFDERLQDEVTQTLNDWQTSGFLDVVISEALQWQLDDYIATNEQDKLSLTTQLSDIATIRVMDFEILEGEVDDTGRIQRAFDQAESIKNTMSKPALTVDFGDGNSYTTSSPILIITSDITVKGRSLVTSNHSGDCFIISTRVRPMSRVYFTELHGMAGIEMTGNFITLDHYNKTNYFHTIGIEKLKINFFDNAIRLYDLKNNNATSCYAQKLSITKCNIHVNKTALNANGGRGMFGLYVSNNYISQNHLKGIDTIIYSGKITGNLLESNPEAIVIGASSEGFVIEGNYFEAVNTMAISVTNSNNFRIGKNYFDSNGDDITKHTYLYGCRDFISEEHNTQMVNCTNGKVDNPLKLDGYSHLKNVDKDVLNFVRDAVITTSRNNDTVAGTNTFPNPITGVPTSYSRLVQSSQNSPISRNYSEVRIPVGTSKVMVSGLIRQVGTITNNLNIQLRFNNGAIVKGVLFSNASIEDKWAYWEAYLDISTDILITNVQAYFYFQSSGGFDSNHYTDISDVGFHIVDDYNKLNEFIINSQ